MEEASRCAHGWTLSKETYVTEEMDVRRSGEELRKKWRDLRSVLEAEPRTKEQSDIELDTEPCSSSVRIRFDGIKDKNRSNKMERDIVHDHAQRALFEQVRTSPVLSYEDHRMEEIVLRVAVYQSKDFGKARKKMQTFLVLGKQSLLDLCRKISCPTEHLALAGNVDTKDCCFMYVERTFYVDGKEAEGLDYSESIRKHAEKWNSTFEVREMSETTFEELSLRVGKGVRYVYMHHGACEHLLAFEDVRLMHPSDPNDPEEYPLLVQSVRKKWKRCEVCEQRACDWVVHKDPLAPGNPCGLCEECYRLLHFDRDGRPIRDGFEAYPYVRG